VKKIIEWVLTRDTLEMFQQHNIVRGQWITGSAGTRYFTGTIQPGPDSNRHAFIFKPAPGHGDEMNRVYIGEEVNQ
jgi:hypothetical protein